MKKKWIILIIIFLIGSFFLYQYINKDHRNISSEIAQFNLSASQLSNEFKLKVLAAEKKYLNKTIIITGKITNIEKGALTLEYTIFCHLEDFVTPDIIKTEKTITIKGRCIGYDELLEEIKFDQCTIVN